MYCGHSGVGKNVREGCIRNGRPLRFVFLRSLRPSADLGLGLDWAWVTEASRMGRLVEASLFATKTRNDGVGSSMIAIIAEIAKIAKPKPFEPQRTRRNTK